MASAPRSVLSSRGAVAVEGAAAFILVGLAASLRFTNLGRGLDHTPFWDEKVFVDSALEMVRGGGLDHHFYEYPALLVWTMALVFRLGHFDGPDAVWAGRAICALASTATVAIVFAALRRRTSRLSAFLATALLALSPIDIETPHAIRPDAVLAPLVLLALLALAQPGRLHLASGLSAIATATKFSGAILLAPLAFVSFSRRVSLKRAVGIAGVFALAFATLSPYTLLAGPASLRGLQTQLGAHYARDVSAPFFSVLFDQFRFGLVKALSPAGLGLALAGAVICWRSRREDRVFVVFVAAWLLVFSTTGVRYERFLVPILGSLVLLAGVGLESLRRRYSSATALSAGLLALFLAGSVSASYLRAIQAPMVADRALAWIRTQPAIHRIYSEAEGFGGGRPGSLEILPRARLAALETGGVSIVDAVVIEVPTQTALTETLFSECHLFPAATVFDGGALRVCRPRQVTLPVLSLNRAAVSASRDEGGLAALSDAQLSTRWRGESGDAIVWRFEEAVTLSRMDILFGHQRPAYEIGIRLEDISDGENARALPFVDGRVDTSLQRDDDPKDPGFSRILLLKPRTLTALRLSFHQAGARVSEVRLFGPLGVKE